MIDSSSSQQQRPFLFQKQKTIFRSFGESAGGLGEKRSKRTKTTNNANKTNNYITATQKPTTNSNNRQRNTLLSIKIPPWSWGVVNEALRRMIRFFSNDAAITKGWRWRVETGGGVRGEAERWRAWKGRAYGRAGRKRGLLECAAKIRRRRNFWFGKYQQTIIIDTYYFNRKTNYILIERTWTFCGKKLHWSTAVANLQQWGA